MTRRREPGEFQIRIDGDHSDLKSSIRTAKTKVPDGAKTKQVKAVTQMQKKEGENFILILLLSIVATLGGFLFGFDSGVINGTVDGLQGAFDSDSAGTGFNVASMLLGCAVGAFFAGRLENPIEFTSMQVMIVKS